MGPSGGAGGGGEVAKRDNDGLPGYPSECGCTCGIHGADELGRSGSGEDHRERALARGAGGGCGERAMSNGRRSGGRLARIGGRHATNRKHRSHEVHANRRCARPGTVARAGADRATPTGDRGSAQRARRICRQPVPLSRVFANHPLLVGQCQDQDPRHRDNQTLSHSLSSLLPVDQWAIALLRSTCPGRTRRKI